MTTQTTRATSSRLVQASQYCPECPIAEVKMPAQLLTVQRVVVKTTSHDQGWSSGGGSWTWFDVVAVSESRSVRRTPDERRVDVNYNEGANPEFQENTTTLRLEADGLVGDWMRSIRPGDTIQLIPRAKFPFWVNIVKEASLEVVWTSKSQTPLDLSDVKSNLDANQWTSLMSDFLPLDASQKQIRLLQIQPGQLDDPIVCHLIRSSLTSYEKRPIYTALSYCWGNERAIDNVTVQIVRSDGTSDQSPECQVRVTPNLYKALRRLRGKSGQPRTVWVDSLCINQEDIEERSHQVSVMHSIYAFAKDVFVWLGEEKENTSTTIKNIQSFIDTYNQDSAAFIAKTNSDVQAPHGKTNIKTEFYSSVCELFDFTWFSRVWVLQEVYNADTAMVQIGEHSLPWEFVVCIGNCVSKAKERARSMSILSIPGIFLSLFEVVRSERDTMSIQRRQSNLDFLSLVIHSLELDATDPRDKIFALIPLWRGSNSESVQKEIGPDYSKNTSQVFADFTVWWIKAHRSLRILSAIHVTVQRSWQRMSANGHPDIPDDRPSWALWHTGSSSWANCTLAYDSECKYRASASTVPDLDHCMLSPSVHLLRLKGVRIGSIRSIRDYPARSDNMPHSADLDEAFEKIFDPAGLSQTWTLCGSTAHTTNPNRDQQLHCHLLAHDEFVAEDDGIFSCVEPCLFSGPGLAGEDLIGLCPYTARVGDEVVVLFGANVPFLIRRSQLQSSHTGEGMQYNLVGECFVQHYMSGRAITEIQEGRLQEENIELV